MCELWSRHSAKGGCRQTLCKKSRCGKKTKHLPPPWPGPRFKLAMSAGFEGTQKRISLRLLLTDIISQMDRPARVLLRDWLYLIKAQRDAGQLPSISKAIWEQGPEVVGPMWFAALERQRIRNAAIGASAERSRAEDPARRVEPEVEEPVTLDLGLDLGRLTLDGPGA